MRIAVAFTFFAAFALPTSAGAREPERSFVVPAPIVPRAPRVEAASHRFASRIPYAEIRRDARRDGSAAVRRQFETGKVVGSRSGEAYPVVNGRSWDKAHGEQTSTPKNPGAYEVKPVADSSERVNAIAKSLEASVTGREALEVWRAHGVNVFIFEGQGAFYSSAKNQVWIGSQASPAKQALSFIHEMNHAHYRNTGKRVDIATASRDGFVAEMTNEETAGVSKEAEALRELRRTNPEAQAFAVQVAHNGSLYAEYREAYAARVRAGRAERLKAQSPDVP